MKPPVSKAPLSFGTEITLKLTTSFKNQKKGSLGLFLFVSLGFFCLFVVFYLLLSSDSSADSNKVAPDLNLSSWSGSVREEHLLTTSHHNSVPYKHTQKKKNKITT